MIINLTSHPIVVRLNDGAQDVDITIQPEKNSPIPRLAQSIIHLEKIDGVFPVVRQEFGEIQNLPPAIDGTTYIVSTLVAQNAKRSDIVSPDTGPTAIRENGQVVAVRGFQRFN